MSSITEFVQHPMVRTMRTGAAVVLSGVLTGSVVYAIAVIVGG